MNHGIPTEIEEILDERFRCDSLLALATVWEGKPYVRPVNAFYEDGAFYIITKRQIRKVEAYGQGSPGGGLRRMVYRPRHRGESGPCMQ